MKRFLYVIVGLAILMMAAKPVLAQENGRSFFEELKSLKGEWEGLNPEGNPVEVTYEVLSGGSIVMETLRPKNESTMITVYHMDDGKLMMTHYCSAGNQPRMMAEISQPGGSKLDFTFVDGTNLKAMPNGHMQNLSIRFKDRDHIEQTWTFRQGNADKPGTFRLTRKS